MPEVVAFLDRYASTISAPVETQTRVTSVVALDDDFVVTTDRGTWHARAVVLATGACNVAHVPAFASAVPPRIRTITSMEYRNPGQLEAGEVLVVGASATGTQLADEIHRSGRPVTLAVGEHVRAPRLYRGKDIEWWMSAIGVHDERYDEVDDIVRARRVPSLQLAGSPDRRTLDLNALTGIGVTLTGRLAGVRDGRAQFSGSLHNACAMADLKMNRLLAAIDRWATEHGLDGEIEAPHRPPPTEVASTPPLGLDLANGRIRTIVWATGYRPDYSWLHVPVLDGKGQIRHDGGVTEQPGLYVMGLQFLRRRKSALIDGAGDDARELSDHLASYLRHDATPLARAS
jgi:putative flavoprotein involved in K+ transport